jgi:hypothetical protein
MEAGAAIFGATAVAGALEVVADALDVAVAVATGPEAVLCPVVSAEIPASKQPAGNMINKRFFSESMDCSLQESGNC